MRYEKEVAWKFFGDKQKAQQYTAQARVVAGELLNANVNELEQATRRVQLAEDVWCQVRSIPGQIIIEIHAAVTGSEEIEDRVAGFIVKTSDDVTGVICWKPNAETWSWIPQSKFDGGLTYGNIVWKNDKIAVSVDAFKERHAFRCPEVEPSYSSDIFLNGKRLCSVPSGAVYGAAIDVENDKLYAIVVGVFTGVFLYSCDYPSDYTEWDETFITDKTLFRSPALFNDDCTTVSFLTSDSWYSEVVSYVVSVDGNVIRTNAEDIENTVARTGSIIYSWEHSNETDPPSLQCETDLAREIWRINFPSCDEWNSTWWLDWFEKQFPVVQGATAYGVAYDHTPDYWTECPGGGCTVEGWNRCTILIPAIEPPTATVVFKPIIYGACGGTYCLQYSWKGGVQETYDSGSSGWESTGTYDSNSSHSRSACFALIAIEGTTEVRSEQHARTDTYINSCSRHHEQETIGGSDYYETEYRHETVTEDFDRSPNPDVECGATTHAYPWTAETLIRGWCITDRSASASTTNQTFSHHNSSWTIQSTTLDPPMQISIVSNGGNNTEFTYTGGSHADCYGNNPESWESHEQCWSVQWDLDSDIKFPLGFDLRCGALLYFHVDHVEQGTSDPAESENNTARGTTKIWIKLPSGTEVLLGELDFPICYASFDYDQSYYQCSGTFFPTYCNPNEANWSNSWSDSYTETPKAPRYLFARWRGFTWIQNDIPWLGDGMITRQLAAQADVIRSGTSFQCNQDIFGHWLISAKVTIQKLTFDQYGYPQANGDPIIFTKNVLDNYVGDPIDIMSVTGDNPFFKDVSVMGWRKIKQ